jgi:putative pyruvate formate lyase activating enzyme
VVEDFEPCYRRLTAAELAAKVESAHRELVDCRACPRDCGVNRMQDGLGTCNTGRHAVVASAFHHFGEEDCLRGWNGSGTIFFALCNLRCVFCQNWDISQQRDGREMTATSIAGVMLRLQHESCHNVNFVTPEHVVPQVVEATVCAIPRGLNLPIVYNTSAYDSVESLRLMEGLVDIYMPDFKFWDPGTARSLARAADYPERPRGDRRDAPGGRRAEGRARRAGAPGSARPPSRHARPGVEGRRHLQLARDRAVP